MAEYIIQDSTLTDIADAIRAKDGSSAPILTEDMADAIAAIPSGTTITDGIVVKARNANGYPTEIDFYGTKVYRSAFGNSSNRAADYIFRYLEKINFKNAVTEIGMFAFRYMTTTLTDFQIPNTVQSIGRQAFAYMGCPIDVIIPASCTAITGQAFDTCLMTGYTDAYLNAESSYGGSTGNQEILRGCRNLITVQFGSIGHPCTALSRYILAGCTQTGLTVTAYCRGDYVDTLLPNLRNGATNATIIIKASENTTYNGTAYAAGETILTSEATA